MNEEIIKIDVSDITDYPKHPFKINNDLNYDELKENVKENGILVPAIVRKKEDEKFEMEDEWNGLPISTPPYTICSKCTSRL